MSTGDGRAVFMDRDGTLIDDVGYPCDPEDVRLLDGSVSALHALHDAGFALIVVSNQSGIGRGNISPGQARAVHRRFEAALRAEGIELDGVSYCPHAPWEDCSCRKPGSRMLVDAAQAHGLHLRDSFMVGDKESDVEAGQRAGCTTVLLGPGPSERGADCVAADWAAAVTFITGNGC